jgi:hypothetical protein
MGLEFVQIVMDVEESFGISFEDDEFTDINTIGDFAEAIKRKLPNPGEGPCLTSHCFYILRSSLIRLFGISRRDLKPTTSMDHLFSSVDRRTKWNNLSKDLELRLPDLCRPTWLEGIIWGGAGLLLLAAITSSFLNNVSSNLPWVFATTAIGFFILAYKATEPFATRFPSHCTTLGGVSRGLLQLNFGKISSRQKSWTDQEVWDSLKRIILETAKVDPDEIVPEAHIYKDLALG